jgi:hypothetical protein
VIFGLVFSRWGVWYGVYSEGGVFRMSKERDVNMYSSQVLGKNGRYLLGIRRCRVDG